MAMPPFVYRGIPIETDRGIVVQPTIGILNEEDGITYKGIVGIDSRGYRFVFRRVPSDWTPGPGPAWYRLCDSAGNPLFDSAGNALFVRW